MWKATFLALWFLSIVFGTLGIFTSHWGYIVPEILLLAGAVASMQRALDERS